MKTLFLLFLCFVPSILFSQEWKPYKIDDSVQVSLPTDFTKVDTLGQTSFTAKTSFGYIQITKQSDNPSTTPDIEKLRHLNSYYDNFVSRIRSSAKDGSIINEKDTLLGNLHVKDFTLAVDSGSGKQLRNIRILHENSATYTFQYLFQDIHEEYAAPESKLFFESIKIPPAIDVESQFTSPENTTGDTPSGNTSIYIGAGLILLIIVGILFYLKKKRGG
ncbi:hypothetical protein WG906_01970 [Pedobacter sp. P351]|uniref:hypothetical protein n=1 Tax=Pedobacter superstes TaxID=3133441 RepID=UPI0030975C56